MTDADLRDLMEILGEIAGSNIDLSAKKRLLLTELCRLIGGDAWVWSLTNKASGEVVYLDAMSGGAAEIIQNRLPFFEGGKPARGGVKSPARETTPKPGKVTSRLSLGEPVRTGLTLSLCQITGDSMSTLVFGRHPDQKPFSLREEEMARVVAEEIGWLHETPPAWQAATSPSPLSERKQATLALLSEGLSYQAISEQLAISPHTVHHYIKFLYRHFGINSRAGLIKQISLRGQ